MAASNVVCSKCGFGYYGPASLCPVCESTGQTTESMSTWFCRVANAVADAYDKGWTWTSASVPGMRTYIFHTELAAQQFSQWLKAAGCPHYVRTENPLRVTITGKPTPVTAKPKTTPQPADEARRSSDEVEFTTPDFNVAATVITDLFYKTSMTRAQAAAAGTMSDGLFRFKAQPGTSAYNAIAAVIAPPKPPEPTKYLVLLRGVGDARDSFEEFNEHGTLCFQVTAMNVEDAVKSARVLASAKIGKTVCANSCHAFAMDEADLTTCLFYE